MIEPGAVQTIALAVLAAAAALPVYAYVAYPLILKLLPPGGRCGDEEVRDPDPWPSVSITVPAYNEAAQIRSLLDALLAVEYPRDRLQVLVVSDASDDGTDRIVREYAGRGAELLRLDARSGKTAAENAALPHLRGEIVVNSDASVRIHPKAVEALVRAFADPTVGVASAIDVSTPPGGPALVREGSAGSRTADTGESRYVGYEMAVRELENRLGGIVGASGCLYAIRRHLHDVPVPEHLSRDFMAALSARDRGYRAVSVPDALCYVPRAASLAREYRRKVRTFTRGMQTLAHMRRLLDPRTQGLFAWKLFSHKVCRWLVPVAGLATLLALAALTPHAAAARWTLVAAGLVGMVAVYGSVQERRGSVRGLPALVLYGVASNLAVLQALAAAIRGQGAALWEPTRRELTTRAAAREGQEMSAS